MNRLDFIRHCRNLDIGLSEIRELLGALDEGSREGAELAHKLIHQHMEAVDRRLKDLRELRRHLLDLEAHCQGKHCDARTCGILAELQQPEPDCPGHATALPGRRNSDASESLR